MKRTGTLRIALAGILALLIGVPGFSLAGCPGCVAMARAASPECHEGSGPELHRACCGSVKAAECCGEMKTPAPARTVETVAVRLLRAPASCVQPPAAARSLYEARPQPASEASPPLLYEAAGLYTLHSVLLI